MDKNSLEYDLILRNLPVYPPVPAEVPWPFYSGDQLAAFAVEAILKDRHGLLCVGGPMHGQRMRQVESSRVEIPWEGHSPAVYQRQTVSGEGEFYFEHWVFLPTGDVNNLFGDAIPTS